LLLIKESKFIHLEKLSCLKNMYRGSNLFFSFRNNKN
jgi:hypothetical protein